MKFIDWSRLDTKQAEQVLARPRAQSDEDVVSAVRDIIWAVRSRGDVALRELTSKFDGADNAIRRLPPEILARATKRIGADTKSAIDYALANIRRFHEAQRPQEVRVQVRPGVVCKKQLRALDTVGLYVPGGSASLPSTMLMLGVPSEIAGCRRRVLCTPPGKSGLPDPAILYAATQTGVDEIYAVGGAQAIAAMAYGTETVPKVTKIFGPGNSWVTEAKQQVARDPSGAGIDLPAGPSELMVVADSTASAEFVAADLLSQAEHGPDSQVMLVSDSMALIEAVDQCLGGQVESLPRRETALTSLASSRSIFVEGITKAIAIANAYAPEHLILNVAEPEALLPAISSAGSVFVGPWSAEALGDYCSGTNHVLPTNGFARYLSGLSVIDFMRAMTVQEISPQGLAAIGPVAITLARHEGLEAHARAVQCRLMQLQSKATA